MFFTKPNIPLSNSFYTEPVERVDPANPASLSEQFSQARNEDDAAHELLSEYWNLGTVYADHNRKVKELTGVELPNPSEMTFGYFDEDGPSNKARFYSDLQKYRDDGGTGSQGSFYDQWREKVYREQLQEVAAKHPDKRAQIIPEMTFEEQGFAARNREVQKSEEVWQRSRQRTIDRAAWLAGSVWGSFDDPVNLVTLPLGFGGKVATGARGVAMGFLKAGASNAAIEAGIQPFVQDYADRAGDVSGWGPASNAVGAAFLFGGALDAGVRSVARGLRSGMGYEPVVKDGVVESYRKIGADGKASELPADLVARAGDNDPAAIREVAEKTGLANDPIVRTSLDAMDAETAVMRKPSEAIPDGEHVGAVQQTLRALDDPEHEPFPVIHENASPERVKSLELDLLEARTDLRRINSALATAGQLPETAARQLIDVQKKITEKVSQLEAQHASMRQTLMSDDLIQMVDGGKVPREVADVVAGHVEDKAIQGRIALDLTEMKVGSPDEARNAIGSLLNSPEYRPEVKRPVKPAPGLAKRELDDPYGSEAKAQLAALQAEFGDVLGVKSEADAAPAAEPDFLDAMTMPGTPAPKAGPEAKVSAALDEAIAFARKILPEGTEVKVAGELEDGAGRALDAAEVNGTIYLYQHAIDPTARIGHEGVHVLERRGLLDPKEVKTLAKGARKEGAFTAEQEASYREAYAGRENIDDLITREAAAHQLEARVSADPKVQTIIDRVKAFFERLRNAMEGNGFRNANDVIDAILSGDVAKREANPEWAQPGGPMYALAQDTDTGQSMRRDLDSLGYYSQALEAAKALRQTKGTPEQFLAVLKKEGVKQAEIDATGLVKFFEGKRSVTKDEIVAHLQQSRVAFKEEEYLAGIQPISKRPAKWQNYSLDPSNPTYRETVLHLPAERRMPFAEYLSAYRKRFPNSDVPDAEVRTFYDRGVEVPGAGRFTSESPDVFRSGHFNEPNIIGHMMTSMTTHEGRPVFTIDQIQSDWGQKLRDGGVRDEAKIAELKARKAVADQEASKVAEELTKEVDALNPEAALALSDYNPSWRNKASPEEVLDGRIGRVLEFYNKAVRRGASDEIGSIVGIVDDLATIRKRLEAAYENSRLLDAEIRTAEAATPGNPLVNTTDQWTNTTLRRAIRQAAEADAEYIAIPSGDTVLSYNPGDLHGMHGFYGHFDTSVHKALRDAAEEINSPMASVYKREAQQPAIQGIVPKNLKNLLAKIDRESPAPQRVETLDSPSGKTGLGKGFTLFPLTDKIKKVVITDGQAMFALRGNLRDSYGKFRVMAKEAGETLQRDFMDIEEDFARRQHANPAELAAAMESERAKLQVQRAAVLNAKRQTEALKDITDFKDMYGRNDPAKGFFYLHESFGASGAKDLVNAKKDIQDEVEGMMAEIIWFARKGAITGDKRRSWNKGVRTTLENMVREASGQDTGDKTAKTLANAWGQASEYLRKRFNAAGGDIGKLKNWIMPQYHDPDALLKMGQQKWIDYMMAKGVLDRDAMVNTRTQKPYTDSELRSVLAYTWKNITSDGEFSREIGKSGGKGAKYKQHADHRFIHFKDADAWLKYQKEVGGGDLYAAMISHISTMSRDIAAMERFGANPELVRQRLKEQILKDAGMGRPSKSMFDELKDKVVELQSTFNAIPTKYESLMNELSKVHGELDAVRSKYAPQLGGKLSKRNVAKVERLQTELFSIHEQLKEEWGKKTLTPEHQKLAAEISDLMDEMNRIDIYPVMSRDPIQRARRLLKRADELWAAFNGTSNVPVNGIIASALSGTRNLISSSALVFAPISAVTDQATHLGARLLVGMPATKQLASFVKGFTPADRQLALHVGIGLDQAANAFQEQARMIGAFNTRGWTGYVTDRSHAFSFLSPMTQASKVAFGLDYMRWMAGLKDTAFDALDEGPQGMLKRGGFTEADWKALQSVQPEIISGNSMLTRKAIKEQAGEELAEKFMIMFYRERSRAVIEGTLAGRTAIVSDTQPGSIIGEGMRSVAMLKSFPISYGSLILGQLFRSIIDGKYKSAAAYFAAVGIVGTMLGATAKQLKNVAQGRDPEDMTTAKFWGASFMQSGGAGIFGDFIASNVNRQGAGLATTLAGPLADRLGTVRDATIGNIFQYASDEKTNAGREATNLLRQWTPGALSPWYTRLAYERLIADALQSQVDPDAYSSFKRKVQSRKKNFGNDFFWAPGQGAPARGPNLGAAFGR